MPTGTGDEVISTGTEDEVTGDEAISTGTEVEVTEDEAISTGTKDEVTEDEAISTGTEDEVISTGTKDEAMPTGTEDEPHRPYLPPYVCTGNVKFRISKTPLWCQKSFFLIQGTLQMTGHSQRRRHSSDDRAHSQRCGYSSTLSSTLVFRPLPLENFWHPVDDGMPGQWCGHSSDDRRHS